MSAISDHRAQIRRGLFVVEAGQLVSTPELTADMLLDVLSSDAASLVLEYLEKTNVEALRALCIKAEGRDRDAPKKAKRAGGHRRASKNRHSHH